MYTSIHIVHYATCHKVCRWKIENLPISGSLIFKGYLGDFTHRNSTRVVGAHDDAAITSGII